MNMPLQITFRHMDPSLGGRFENLATGSKVRFAEESGDLGPQASTVHVIR